MSRGRNGNNGRPPLLQAIELYNIDDCEVCGDSIDLDADDEVVKVPDRPEDLESRISPTCLFRDLTKLQADVADLRNDIQERLDREHKYEAGYHDSLCEHITEIKDSLQALQRTVGTNATESYAWWTNAFSGVRAKLDELAADVTALRHGRLDLVERLDVIMAPPKKRWRFW